MKRISALLIATLMLVGTNSAMALEGSREPSLNPSNLNQLVQSQQWILRTSSNSLGECIRNNHAVNQKWTAQSKELIRNSLQAMQPVSTSKPLKVSNLESKNQPVCS